MVRWRVRHSNADAFRENATIRVMLTTVASDTVLDAAYEWLCVRCKNWPADSDVWSLRFC